MNKVKPIILQVLPALYSGGVERGTVDIAKALQDKKYGSIVASAGGPMVNAIERAGAMHITLPLRSKNPWHIYRNIAQLEKIIKEHKVDIVHARSRAPAISAYFAAKRTGCKFLTTFHGSYGMGNALKRWYNSIMTKGQKIIAVSNFIAQYILSHYPKIDPTKITVIHRGVDTNAFNPTEINFQRLENLKKLINIPDDKLIIMMPARITRWKGHITLINALAQLPKNKIHCVIVGSVQNNNYFHEILELIGKLGLDDNVSFAKAVEDMPALYMLCDAVVVPSLKPEAFGRIPIEAGAMAKIAIASNIGGCLETIIHEKTGFLFEAGNEKMLASQLSQVLNLSQPQIKEIGINARSHIIKHFSLEKMITDTIALYDSL